MNAKAGLLNLTISEIKGFIIKELFQLLVFYQLNLCVVCIYRWLGIIAY